MQEQKGFKQIDIYSYQKAKPGESCNGDAFFVKETEDYFICAVADGLGSGVLANASSQKAVSVIKEHHEESVKQLMERANKSLLEERGAVLAIFKIYYENQTLEYSCVGNIKFMLRSPSGNTFYPMPTLGYLSGRPQKFHVQNFTYEKGSSFFIHSDGLEVYSVKKTMWELQTLKEVYQKIQQILTNSKDDVTFLIGKIS